MFSDPRNPPIIDALTELRFWLDGFLTDREKNEDAGEVWPNAITGDHLDALEVTLDWMKATAEMPLKFNEMVFIQKGKGDPDNDK